MRITKALWIGAIALVLVVVLLIVQLTTTAPSRPQGAIGGQMAVSGCNPKASQIRLLARPMKGEAGIAPDGSQSSPVETTSTTSTSITTTTTTTTTTVPTQPLDDAETKVAPSSVADSTPPSTATSTTTTTSPPPLLTTTTTEPPLVLTTTTTAGGHVGRSGGDTPQIAPRQVAPRFELASQTSASRSQTGPTVLESRELKASVRKVSQRAFEFVFEKAKPGIAYQLGGTIENDSCDGASWAGPANGIVIADEKGKLQVPVAVTVAMTLRVYASNSKYMYLNGALRQHWQGFDAVDVTKDATRIFRWEMPTDAAKEVEWQVSLLPFGKSCDPPVGLVASGTASHAGRDNPNAPANIFTVDFSKLHQSLFGTTGAATTETPKPAELALDGSTTTEDVIDDATTGKPFLSAGSLSYYGVTKDHMQMALVSMFNGTYHVRAVPKNGSSCGDPSNSVTVREVDGKQTALSTTEVEVNRFNKEIGKDTSGKPMPIWGIADEMDWSSVQYGKRVFHWATMEPKAASGEWQLYRAGDEPVNPCGDPPSLIYVGKAPYQPGALDAAKLDTSFTVDFNTVAKKLDKAQSYNLRIVPKTRDGSCAGLPSNSIHISFASRAMIDVNKGYGQLEVYKGGGAPYVLEGANFGSANWTTSDSVDWIAPSNAKRSFHWSVANADDVTLGRWQLLAPDAKNVAATCDDPPGVLASGPVPYVPGPLSSKKMNVEFDIDLSVHAAKLDVAKPVYARVVATRQGGSCDIVTQPVTLTWKPQPAFEVTQPPAPPSPPPAAPIRTEVIGYTPLSAPSATPPYCYTVVNPFKASDAVEQMRAFQEDPAFLPVDANGFVVVGTRLCFTPAVPQKETEPYFGTMVDEGIDYLAPQVEQISEQTGVLPAIAERASETAKERLRQVLLAKQHRYAGVPEPCPAEACVSDNGARTPFVELAVTRDVAAPADLPNVTYACVYSQNPDLYTTTCARLPTHMQPGQTITVPIALRVDLDDEVEEIMSSDSRQFKPADGISFDSISFNEWWKSQALSLWKTQTMDTTPSFTFTSTDGPSRTLTTKQPWGVLATEN